LVAGAWLVARGLATRGAVQGALRRQLRARLAAVLQSRGLDYRFSSQLLDLGGRFLEEAPSTADLVLSAMRDLVGGWPLPDLARVIEVGRLGLTGLGRELLRDATLCHRKRLRAACSSEAPSCPRSCVPPGDQSA
jgi:hypothetical protein